MLRFVRQFSKISKTQEIKYIDSLHMRESLLCKKTLKNKNNRLCRNVRLKNGNYCHCHSPILQEQILSVSSPFDEADELYRRIAYIRSMYINNVEKEANDQTYNPMRWVANDEER